MSSSFSSINSLQDRIDDTQREIDAIRIPPSDDPDTPQRAALRKRRNDLIIALSGLNNQKKALLTPSLTPVGSGTTTPVLGSSVDIELARLREENRRYADDLRRRPATIATLERDLQAARDRIAKLTSDLSMAIVSRVDPSQAMADIDRLQKLLDVRTDQVNRLAADLRAAQDATSGDSGLRQALVDAQDRVRMLEMNASQSSRTVDDLTNRRRDAEALVQLLTDQLAAARSGSNQSNTDLQKKLAESEAALALMKSQADGLERQIAIHLKTIADTNKRHEEAHSADEQRLAQLRVELDEMKKIFDQLTAAETTRAEQERLLAEQKQRLAAAAARLAAGDKIRADQLADATQLALLSAQTEANQRAAEQARAFADIEERQRQAAARQALEAERQLEEAARNAASSSSSTGGEQPTLLRRAGTATLGAMYSIANALSTGNQQIGMADSQAAAASAAAAAAAAASTGSSAPATPLNPTSGTRLSVPLGSLTHTWVRMNNETRRFELYDATPEGLGLALTSGLTERQGVWYAGGSLNFYTSPQAMVLLVERIVAPTLEYWYREVEETPRLERALFTDTVEPLLFFVARAIDLERARRGTESPDLDDAFNFMYRVTEWLLIKGLTKSEASSGPNDKYRQQTDAALNTRVVPIFDALPMVGATIAGVQAPAAANAIRGANRNAADVTTAAFPPLYLALDKRNPSLSDPVIDTPLYQALIVAATQLSDARVIEFIRQYNARVSAANEQIGADMQARAIATSQEWRNLAPTLDDYARTVDVKALVGGRVGGRETAYRFFIYGDTFERAFMLNLLQLFVAPYGVAVLHPTFGNLYNSASQRRWAISPLLFPTLFPPTAKSAKLPTVPDAQTVTPAKVANAVVAAGGGSAARIIVGRDDNFPYTVEKRLALARLVAEMVALLQAETNVNYSARQALTGLTAFGLFLPLQLVKDETARSLFERFGGRPQFVRTRGGAMTGLSDEQIDSVTVKSAAKPQPQQTVNTESFFDRVRKMSGVIRGDKRVHAQAIGWIDAASLPADGVKNEKKSTFELIDESLSPHKVTVFVPTNRLFALTEKVFERAGGRLAKGTLGRGAAYFVVRGEIDVEKTLTGEFNRFHTITGDPIEMRKVSKSGDIINIENSGALRIVFRSDKNRNGWYYLVDTITDGSSGYAITPPDIDWTRAVVNAKPLETYPDNKIGRPTITDERTGVTYAPLPSTPETRGGFADPRRAPLPPPLTGGEEEYDEDEDDDEGVFEEARQTVVTQCGNKPEGDDLGTLMRVIDRAGLHQALFGDGSRRFTVFAPTAAAGLAGADARTLRYHVVRGDLDSEQVFGMMRRGEAVPTLDGATLRFMAGEYDGSAGSLFASDLEDVDQMLIASSGKRHSVRVHFINRVLRPPARAGGMLDENIASPYYSEARRRGDSNDANVAALEAALKRANLDDALFAGGAMSVTVFAPTASALAAAGAAALTPAHLADVLKYHVVVGDISAKKVADLSRRLQSRRTLSGQSLTFSNNLVPAQAGYIDSSDIVTADKKLKGGQRATPIRVHFISRILVPPMMLSETKPVATTVTASQAKPEATAVSEVRYGNKMGLLAYIERRNDAINVLRDTASVGRALAAVRSVHDAFLALPNTNAFDWDDEIYDLRGALMMNSNLSATEKDPIEEQIMRLDTSFRGATAMTYQSSKVKPATVVESKANPAATTVSNIRYDTEEERANAHIAAFEMRRREALSTLRMSSDVNTATNAIVRLQSKLLDIPNMQVPLDWADKIYALRYALSDNRNLSSTERMRVVGEIEQLESAYAKAVGSTYQRSKPTPAAAETVVSKAPAAEVKSESRFSENPSVTAYQARRRATIRALADAKSSSEALGAAQALSAAFADVDPQVAFVAIPNWTSEINEVRAALARNPRLNAIEKRAAHAEIGRLANSYEGNVVYQSAKQPPPPPTDTTTSTYRNYNLANGTQLMMDDSDGFVVDYHIARRKALQTLGQTDSLEMSLASIGEMERAFKRVPFEARKAGMPYWASEMVALRQAVEGNNALSEQSKTTVNRALDNFNTLYTTT